jgi:hypothetical protein
MFSIRAGIIVKEVTVSEIDPVEYGKLIAKVDALEKEMAEVSTDVKALLELANKGRGGFWVGMTIAASLGAVVSWFSAHFLGR